jgi:two-component system, NtrC family, sensor kinase
VEKPCLEKLLTDFPASVYNARVGFDISRVCVDLFQQGDVMGMAKVYFMNGPNKGRSYEIEKDTIYVGRSPKNDVRITDKSVSRVHLRIVQKGNRYFITDLKSRNGTFIDGVRIGPNLEYEVLEGKPVAIGKTFFSLGSPYPDDVLAVLDSIDLFKELDKDDGSSLKDRPSTAKKNMELIYKVSTVLMQSVNTKEILEKIIHHIMEVLRRIDRGLIFLVNLETGEIGDAISISKNNDPKFLRGYSRSIVNRVVREAKPVSMLDTLAEGEGNLSESIRINKIRSVMCVPLISRARVMGVIYVDSVQRPNGFRKEDLELLTALSSPAALAIENSQLSALPKQARSA